MRRDEDFDASGDAPLSRDEAVAFEAEDHLMDRRRADAEVTLYVGLGGRLAEHVAIDVDEGEVVALLLGEPVQACAARAA